MVWNIVFTDKLPHALQPEIFWNDISPFLTYGENISRIIVFIISLLMPLRISTLTQKRGFFLYLIGTLLYFASWIILIYFPSSNFSNSILVFMAPAYTPLLWLIGIGLIGNSFYFKIPFRRWFFILAATIFLIFHNFHTLIIYCRINYC